MGSRKKKIPTDKQRFLAWYRSLSIMDKIAYKAYLFIDGRGRIQLIDQLKYPYFWQFGPIKRKQMVEEGYAIQWH
jgi:hypothetical protein